MYTTINLIGQLVKRIVTMYIHVKNNMYFLIRKLVRWNNVTNVAQHKKTSFL